MSVFGLSYPPGVTGNEPEIVGYEGPCDICGRGVDDCVCPECPECGSYGDPVCYEAHGLVRTQEQVDSRTECDRQYAEAAEQEARFYAAEQASEENGQLLAVEENYMTTKEAAAELGVSTARIRDLIAQGRIAAVKRQRTDAGGMEWAIEADALDSVRDRRPGKASPVYGLKTANKETTVEH